MSYDPAGRLHQTIGGGVTTRFLYDGVDAIAEYNSSNVMQRRFVHGPSFDEPIVWYEGSGTSDRRWLVQDQLGSVIAATNTSGALIGSPNTYDEFGVPGTSNIGRFQYTGQMWIGEAALYHYKARAYAPALGRFLQTDPIVYAGGMNIYAYVGNDAINWRDPLGLQDQTTPEPDSGQVEEITVTGQWTLTPAPHSAWGSHWPGIIGGGQTQAWQAITRVRYRRPRNPVHVRMPELEPDEIVVTGRRPPPSHLVACAYNCVFRCALLAAPCVRSVRNGRHERL